jgi:hypothetical protein
MTNRDNSFRLANSQEAINDDVLFIDGAIHSAIAASNLTANTIAFNIQNDPVLEFRPNGDIYVQGRLAANDMEVVEAMRRFLGGQGLL